MLHVIWATKGKWALVIKLEENDTSCGTSWILSRARIWSSVSMDGDNPPWRQNIYKQVQPASDENKKVWNTTTASVHLHRTDHNAMFCPLINKKYDDNIAYNVDTADCNGLVTPHRKLRSCDPAIFRKFVSWPQNRKIRWYRKIRAKYTVFTTIFGVAFLLSPYYNDFILLGNPNDGA